MKVCECMRVCVLCVSMCECVYLVCEYVKV